jgi:hypothetical protein
MRGASKDASQKSMRRFSEAFQKTAPGPCERALRQLVKSDSIANFCRAISRGQGETMSVQKSRTAKKTSQAKSNGKEQGGNKTRPQSLSYESAKTGIVRADVMGVAIDEIYRKAASGEAVAPSLQANTMLNAVGKMLALENLKLRAGHLARTTNDGIKERFFLEG